MRTPAMLRFSRGRNNPNGDAVREHYLSTTTASANRRRLVVFAGTLAVALAIGLCYTWLRPAEYRTSARVDITPGSGSLPGATDRASAPESARPFLTEVQVLVSRPILQMVAARLERSGQDPSAFGSDPVAGMQSHLEAMPVAGTNVVEVVATGPHPELLAPLVNATLDVYRERLADAYRSSSSESMAQADEEVQKLEARVVAKRREVETFRMRYNIVSLERGENEVLAQVRNLGTSLGTANERVATAEGKWRAIADAAAAGKAVVRARDDPTLANLEQRASQIREDLRDLERGYTPDYLAREPKAIASRARLAELERQITVQRETSQQAALLEAQQDLASARSAAARIQSQIAAGRGEVAQFTTRFNVYKAQQDELADLETAHRDAVSRRARLDASVRARMPTTKVLEAAATPLQPWRPPYWRDTALAVGGSLLLALLAMWLVELFNRSDPQPAVILVQSHSTGMLNQAALHRLPWQDLPDMIPEAATPALLAQPKAFPRELRPDEVAALVHSTDDDGLLVMLLLLSGISVGEVVELRSSDVDLARSLIHVGAESGRDVTLSNALRRLLAARPAASASEWLVGHPGRPATADSIDAQILCAAHDARLENASSVTAACVRHTYVSFLVRQGIRFADLTRIVGHLPSDALAAYSVLAPAGPRVGRDTITLELAAVRDIVPD